MEEEETLIAAPVTPAGTGAITIVRLSGSGAFACAQRILPPQRHAALLARERAFFYSTLRDPTSGRKIDTAVVLCFPAPHSYTGEDVVEFQLHGGRLPSQMLLDLLKTLGVRMALPGEFTRRAFLNGRIDLSQAEAVMDLIGAQSERAARLALEHLQGALRHDLESRYEALMGLCSDVEASLDFSEDELPELFSIASLKTRMAELQVALEQLVTTAREGQLLREGVQVVISGRPNAGKSALFNALLGRNRAIVSEQPGTTRDTIEETLLLDGIPLRLADTAGLRVSASTVEQQGVARAQALVRQADLHLRVFDPGEPWSQEDLKALLELPSQRTIVALSKADLVPHGNPTIPEPYRRVSVSALTGEGLDVLRNALREVLDVAAAAPSEGHIAVSARHREALEQSLFALQRAEALCGNGDAVLIAQALREAAEALGEITGRNVGEDVLDHIFARFCVGK